ncbi:MAG: hypothetical protein CMJ81_01875 [Planctomycetaceae bacterium]|nr:hypothetical protein [Planctomycetaceae bacterium]
MYRKQLQINRLEGMTMGLFFLNRVLCIESFTQWFNPTLDGLLLVQRSGRLFTYITAEINVLTYRFVA